MQAKITLALTAATLVIVALATATAIQLVGAQNPIATPNPTQTVPPCPYPNGNTANVPGYFYNGTAAGALYGCHGYGAQGSAQYPPGCMMGGYGMHGRGWW